MIILVIYAIISFLLDGFMSNYINTNIVDPSYFLTIYTIIALVIIINYFENPKKYLYIMIILGILFDIIYTNTFLLNIFIFFIIHLLLRVLNEFLSNNIITINIKSLLAIATYHIITYIMLLVTNYRHFEINSLLTVLSHSIIATIIYTTISYLIIDKIYIKKNTKKIK